MPKFYEDLPDLHSLSLLPVSAYHVSHAASTLSTTQSQQQNQNQSLMSSANPTEMRGSTNAARMLKSIGLSGVGNDTGRGAKHGRQSLSAMRRRRSQKSTVSRAAMAMSGTLASFGAPMNNMGKHEKAELQRMMGQIRDARVCQ